jgi:hypothetical protein
MDKHFKKLRDKTSRFVHRVQDSARRQSRGTTPEPQSTASASGIDQNDPTPSASAILIPNDATPVLTPAAIKPSIVAAPVPAVATPSQSIPLASGPASNILPKSGSAPSAPQISQPNTKQPVWVGLKTLAGALEGVSSAFGPLKSAVEALSGCVEVYEVRLPIDLVSGPCI